MKAFNLIVAILALVYSFKTQAQDAISWGHHITFSFENIGTSNKNDSLISLEFFTNTEYLSTACQGSEIKSEKAGEYVLAYSCSAIGGASQVWKVKCPDIYLKLEFEIVLNTKKKKKVTKLIPFVFEAADGPNQKITVPEIDISNLWTKKAPVVLIDALGNYQVVEQHTMENQPVIFNLVKFEKNK